MEPKSPKDSPLNKKGLITLRIAIGMVVLFLTNLPLTKAQQPELVLQTGHTHTLEAIEYTMDGRWILTSSRDRKIVVWDARLTLQYREFGDFRNEITHLCSDHAGKYVLGYDNYNVIVYVIETGEKVFHYQCDISGNCGTLHPFLPQIAYVKDSKLEIFDFVSNQVLHSMFTPQFGVKSLKYSPEGKYLAVGRESGMFSLFDAEKTYKEIYSKRTPQRDVIGIEFSSDSKSLVYLFEKRGSEAEIKNIVFLNIKSKKEYAMAASPEYAGARISISPDNKILAVAGSGLWTFDMKTGTRLKEYACNRSIGAIWSRDGKFLAVGWEYKKGNYQPGLLEMRSAGNPEKQLYIFDGYAKAAAASASHPHRSVFSVAYVSGEIHVFDLKTGLHSGTVMKGEDKWINHQPSTLTYSPDAKLLAVGVNWGRAMILDSETLKFRKEILQYDGTIYTLMFSKDGQFFYGGGGYVDDRSYFRKWKTADFTLDFSHETLFKSKIIDMSLSPDGQTFVLKNDVGDIGLFSTKTMEQLKVKRAIPTSGLGTVLFSPDGKSIMAGYNEGEINFFNINDFKIEPQSIKTNGMSRMAFNSDKSRLAIAEIDNGVPQISVYNTNNWSTPLFSFKGHEMGIGGLDWSFDNKLLFSSSRDGTARIWHAKNGTELAKFIGTSPSDYVLITPDNYYMGTKGGMQGVAFRLNNRVLPFDQFDLRFNRPDIVLDRIGQASPELIAAYKRAWEKRVRNLGFQVEQLSSDFHLPEIKILTQNIPTTTTESQITLEVKTTDNKYKLKRVLVFDNDVAVFGKNGIDLTSLNTSDISIPVQIPLQSGKNRITISVVNERGAESIREITEIFNTTPEGSTTLFVVAIGVSEYVDRDFNLTYAAKDARDVVSTFKTNNSFGAVKTFLLTDSEATLQNIKNVKKELLQSKTNDQVVVLFAGHGLLDSQLDYYLATHDVNFASPSVNGLPYSELENLLDSIPARHKLMLIDACHSGEVDKEEMVLADAGNAGTGTIKTRGFKAKAVEKSSIGLYNSFELMKQLFADISKGTGAMVISSASGAEFAFESAEWNNGVFTYSLLEGLKTGKADLDENKQITVSELRSYVFSRVKELTNGKQNPTSRQENLEFDFRVW